MRFNLNLDSINYVKLLWQDLQGAPCCRKTAIKFMGETEMCLCTTCEDDEFRIKTPQNVTVSFACDNGLYRTMVELIHSELRNSYVYFTLKTPEGLEFQQNREYFRVKMTEKAILSFKQNNEIKRVPSTTFDISANGVKLVIPEKYDNLEEVLINIMFDTRDFKSKARFVRYDDEDGVLKASFQFVELPNNDVDFISQKCIQKQLEYKRNNARS